MEVLAEKLRGLSKGLLPAAGERGKVTPKGESHPKTHTGVTPGVLRAAPSGEREGKSLPKLFPPGKGTRGQEPARCC